MSKYTYFLIYKKIKYYSLFICTLISFHVKAQYEINGSAVHTGSGDYILTPASEAQVGSIWFKKKISLKESFDLDFELYFGTKNGGAGGISFCLQPLSTSIGISGGSLGIQGVNPSFFAEFDTYRNSGDPDFDHIAVQKNGDVLNTGANNLVSAVRIKSGVDDVENGLWYPIQVKWNATLKKFDIYVDCILRVSYSGDIVNSIFDGDPNVYWGLTASTGGVNNEQRVKNIRTNLIKLDDQIICKNGNIQVNVPPTSSNFSWSPTTGINNTNSLNPIFSPTKTTEYMITYDGFCNTFLTDTFLITVNSVEGKLGNDTTICDSETLSLDAGPGQSYLWNTDATTQEINTTTTGTYSVTVTHHNGCISNDEIILNTISCNCDDTDGDGICNKDDLDDDNDGILDEIECPTAQVSTTFQTSGGTTTSFDAPAADKGFLFNIYKLDNSFNLNINGADLVPDQIQCQGAGSAGESQLVFVSDNTGYGFGGNDNIWIIQGTKQSPVIQVNIDQLGDVSILGKRNTGAKLELMMVKPGHPQTQILTWNPTGINKVILSQKVIGPTSISGEGFGVMECSEDTDGDGILNHLDPDSDGDGCLDALEGTEGFEKISLLGEMLKGSVDINGVPTIANGGQEIGTSVDPNTISFECKSPILVLDTLYVCNGDKVIIEQANVDIGEWTGTEPFTKISEGSIEIMPTKSTTYYLSSFIKKQNNLINGDFEQPYRNSFGIISDATVPGWSTTASDRMIEFWVDGFLNTPSYTGDQFVELNANMPAALYQDMLTTPGDKLVWGFAHRGRNGVESMHFEVGAPGDPYVKIKTVSTGMNWEYYSGIYLVPTSQTTTRFHYTSAMPGSTGNLLDAIEFYSVEEKVDSFIVIVKKSGELKLGNDTTICEGDKLSITANITGPYNWNNGEKSKTIQISETGIYSLNIKDSNKCLTTDSIKVIVNNLPSVNLGNDTTLCAGEELTLNAQNPGFNYSWDSGEKTKTMNISNKGEYRVVVSDDNGCADSDSILISFKSLPIVNIGNDTNICEVNEITLNALNPGLNFKWNTNETTQTITINKTGIYGVEVRDNAGCLGSDSMLLTVNSMPIVNFGNDTTICIGESLILNAFNSGLNYTWNTGEKSQTINPSLTGIYGVEVRDNIGCSGSDSLMIKVNQLPFVKIRNDTSICEVDNVKLNALNPGLSFKWNTNETTQTITINKTGIYGVEVRDNAGCLGSDSMLLTVNPVPLVDLGNDTSICIGESLILNTFNPGLNSSWNTGETTQTINTLSTGVYGVEVRDNLGCIGSDSLRLTVNQLPVVNLGNDTSICMYQTLILDAENPRFNYIWSNGSTTNKISIDKEAMYSVEVRDNIGCIGSDEIMVSKDIISDPFTEKSKIICEGDVITLEPDPGYNDYLIFWISAPQNSSINVSETGIYSSVVQSNFCKDTFEINVTKIDTPDVLITDLNGKPHYCFDYETTLLLIESNNGDINEYNWSDFGETDEVEIIESGEYKVEVTNDYCLSRYSVNVKEYCSGNLFVPNSFTPNGDGINDIFQPISNDHVDGYELIIYDRWGEPIFTTNKIEEGWDGKINESIVLIDVYIYKISYNYSSKNGGIKRSGTTGTVTILK